jgi:hypothetical protein
MTDILQKADFTMKTIITNLYKNTVMFLNFFFNSFSNYIVKI